ncbi:hypothetical protein L195_g027067 [Trifolium pratense]|uniref:Uncharacterized protein n=1 Tax=Trifolium pratense TaxID=57577 RepID=A0A2K3KY42_TRIPR|nr:hypothetical protein L195_g027067 [Trifolium pratense]
MLDASSGGALLSKSYTEGFAHIESVIANIYQWPTTRTTPAPASSKKPTSMHEVSKTIVIVVEVAQIHNMMKTLLTPLIVSVAEPVNVVADTTKVGKIVIALSLRPSGTLPSTIESLASTSTDKGKETCKVISLRSGREYDGPNMRGIMTEVVHEDSVKPMVEDTCVLVTRHPISSDTRLTKSCPKGVKKSSSDKTPIDIEVARLSSYSADTKLL